MSPQQIEATIAIVRAAAAGDPLDDSHTLRGHLAMVLSALDDARRERDKAKSHAEAMQIERDEMRANMEFVAGEARQAIASAKRERDEARRALRTIAAAFGCEPDDPDDLAEAARMLVAERDEARVRESAAVNVVNTIGHLVCAPTYEPGTERCEAAVDIENSVRSLLEAQDERNQALHRAECAEAERDEARAALASEPARIAAAEMARDVAWVRKVARSVDRTPAIEAIARALDLSPLGGVKVYMADQSDADIAAAIRAVRGAS